MGTRFGSLPPVSAIRNRCAVVRSQVPETCLQIAILILMLEVAVV